MEPQYPRMIEGSTNMKLCIKIISMQFDLLRPSTRSTALSKAFVSTDIISSE
jgi:hypothetical protein